MIHIKVLYNSNTYFPMFETILCNYVTTNEYVSGAYSLCLRTQEIILITNGALLFLSSWSTWSSHLVFGVSSCYPIICLF